MFSQASVILSTGGGGVSASGSRVGMHPQEAPLGQTPPGQTPPWANTPRDGHYGGRYAF